MPFHPDLLKLRVEIDGEKFYREKDVFELPVWRDNNYNVIEGKQRWDLEMILVKWSKSEKADFSRVRPGMSMDEYQLKGGRRMK